MEPDFFPFFPSSENHQPVAPVAVVVPQGELQLSILESKAVDSLLLCWEVAFETGQGEVKIVQWLSVDTKGQGSRGQGFKVGRGEAFWQQRDVFPQHNHVIMEKIIGVGTKKLVSGVKVRPGKGAAIPARMPHIQVYGLWMIYIVP